MSVMRRAAGSASKSRSAVTSVSRPRRAVRGRGSETPLSSSTASGMRGCPRARQERVTRRTSQVKRRGQRAHGLEMGPPSFSALQRADRVDRESGNRREFLLRKARSLAERFELRTE